jgi:hypothetical protein
LLSYNKELWDRAGLLPPKPNWTMQDMLAAARKLANTRGDTVEIYGTLALGAQQALYNELLSVGIDLFATPAERVRLDQLEIAAALDYDVRWQPNEYESEGFVERVRPLELTNSSHAQEGCPTCGAQILANRTEVVCACGQPVFLI